MTKNKKTIITIITVILMVAVAAIFLLPSSLFALAVPQIYIAQISNEAVLTVPDEPYTYNGTGNFDPKADVTAVDYDGTDITEKITVSIEASDSKTEKTMLYSVSGKYLKTTTAERKLILSDYNGPSIDFNVSDIETDIADRSHLVDNMINNADIYANDGFGNDITRSIISSNISNITTPGTHNISFSVTNFLNDSVTASMNINITGTIHSSPIVLRTTSVSITTGDTFRPGEYVTSAYDDTYGNLLSSVKYTTNLKPGVPGNYTVNYYVSGVDGVSSDPVILNVTVIESME